MGVPSVTILLHEILKLLHYAEAVDPVIFRIGTCGGLGIMQSMHSKSWLNDYCYLLHDSLSEQYYMTMNTVYVYTLY